MHALRHTFASQPIEYGADVVELRDILGHALLATTSRYLDANTHSSSAKLSSLTPRSAQRLRPPSLLS